MPNGFPDGVSRLLVPALQHRPIFLPPSHCILQIYSQTDGSYMGSPEMSPLYSIVNALTQTAAAIILILASPPLLRSCIPLSFLPSSCLLSSPGSISFLPFLFHILSAFCLTHTHTHTHRSLESGTFETPTLSAILCLFLSCTIILPLLLELHQMTAISIKSESSVREYARGEAHSLTCRLHKYHSFSKSLAVFGMPTYHLASVNKSDCKTMSPARPSTLFPSFPTILWLWY